MKRILSLLVASIMLMYSVNAKTKYVAANLNLRVAPTTQSKVLSVIPRGTTIEIDDCDCAWVPVYYNGNAGYVCARYITDRQPVAKPLAIPVAKPLVNIRYYTNTYGDRVQSPTHYTTRPAGATALCRDGTYSFSRSRRGTCSHHGGVARWL